MSSSGFLLPFFQPLRGWSPAMLLPLLSGLNGNEVKQISIQRCGSAFWREELVGGGLGAFVGGWNFNWFIIKAAFERGWKVVREDSENPTPAVRHTAWRNRRAAYYPRIIIQPPLYLKLHVFLELFLLLQQLYTISLTLDHTSRKMYIVNAPSFCLYQFFILFLVTRIGRQGHKHLAA